IQIERQVKDLSEGIMKLRLISVGESFERMRFVVRDLVSKSGKSINLVFQGEDTQIDKFVMEKMFDPLLHLVRNAVSHGIETPVERESLGKSQSGQILLSASASGNTVVFEVADDGYGINPEKIIEKAIKSGFLDNGTGITNTDLLKIMSTPGFSTREQSDMASGRGMGMDIVSRTVNELGGSIEMDSVKGSGTRFTIQLPLILSIVNALIISSGMNSFAIPMPAVNEIISIEEGNIEKFMSDEMIFHQGSIIPVMRLQRYFHLAGNAASHYVVVVESGHERAGIIVDKIIGKREIVVRSLSDPLIRVAGISGATELGDGRIVLILDTSAMVRSLTSGKKLKKETTI
ncbi:MAG TPA: chemotaxis protein CheW, partial [Bacteroidales bacterium]|nr:chemotaxis protein CheW [Bacteroidales bacterium]